MENQINATDINTTADQAPVADTVQAPAEKASLLTTAVAMIGAANTPATRTAVAASAVTALVVAGIGYHKVRKVEKSKQAACAAAAKAATERAEKKAQAAAAINKQGLAALGELSKLGGTINKVFSANMILASTVGLVEENITEINAEINRLKQGQ